MCKSKCSLTTLSDRSERKLSLRNMHCNPTVIASPVLMLMIPTFAHWPPPRSWHKELMWFVLLVINGESRYRRRPICHAEPCCHATGVWLLLYNVFLCVFSVFCFIRELKVYWINHNKCIVWSLLSPWYCINKKEEEEKKKTHLRS